MKRVCLTAVFFLAHLMNQGIVHEVLLLEIVTHLLHNPTEDSVEVLVLTLKECGQVLTQLCASGMNEISKRIEEVYQEGRMDSKTNYLMEYFLKCQKDGFKAYCIPTELNIVGERNQITHLINLDEKIDGEEILNEFQYEDSYTHNEELYKHVIMKILDDFSENGMMYRSKDEEKDNIKIRRLSIDLKRRVYRILKSHIKPEECAENLLNLKLNSSQTEDLCSVMLNTCAQEPVFDQYYGLVAQSICKYENFKKCFTEMFKHTFLNLHQFEVNERRNVAKLFAYLLYPDVISWNVLSVIELNEADTESRIFLKTLFETICFYMESTKLTERLNDMTFQEEFEGLFPRENARNYRFATGFFASIGLFSFIDRWMDSVMKKPKISCVNEEKASSSTSS